MSKSLIAIFMLIFLMQKPAAAETLLSLCNESNETLYIAVRAEDGLLTGGGYPTFGWEKLGVRGFLKSCYRTRVARRWTKHFVIAVRRGKGFVPIQLDGLRGYKRGLSSNFCVSTNLGRFSYRVSSKNDKACKSRFALVRASVNVYGGDKDATLYINGKIAANAKPVIGVLPTEKELADEKAKRIAEHKKLNLIYEKKRKQKKQLETQKKQEKLKRQEEILRLSKMSESAVFKEIRDGLTDKQLLSISELEAHLKNKIIGVCEEKLRNMDVFILASFANKDGKNVNTGFMSTLEFSSWLPDAKDIEEIINGLIAGSSKPYEAALKKITRIKDKNKFRRSVVNTQRDLSKFKSADTYISWSVEYVKGPYSIPMPHICFHNFASRHNSEAYCMSLSVEGAPDMSVAILGAGRFYRTGKKVYAFPFSRKENIINCPGNVITTKLSIN